MNKRLTYIAGDIMTRGSQLQRAEERAKLEATGIAVYNPQDNDDINDKSKLPLAERIVAEDIKRLFAATDIVIEPQPHAQGTLVELGIIYGMKALAAELKRQRDNVWADDSLDYDQTLAVVDGIDEALIERVLAQKVYPHNSDIRRTDSPESGDRRSFSVNQFVYGVVLALTDGKGFYDFDEAVELIKEDGGGA